MNPIQAKKSGAPDAFVAELNATASSIYFSTYLGGSSYEEATGIAVDPSANVYITGHTKSTDFPC